MNEKTYCVYIHTNKINGKCYVGMTGLKPEQRWNNGYGYKCQKHFYNDIVKYGWDNFEHEIIIDNITDKKEAQLKEVEMMKQYDSIENGYNKNHAEPKAIKEKQKKNYYKKKREEKLIHCIELNLTFKTSLAANEATGIDSSSILKACKGIRKSAGKHPETNDPLHWEYIEIDQGV